MIPKNATFNNNLSMKFYTYKKETIKNNLPIKVFKCFKVMEFRSDDFKKFISTFWHDKVDDNIFIG